LGIGITAKSIADMGIPVLDIVEISPEVTRVAADAYAYVNNNILAYENISITIEDGRSLLLRSKELYDMIICNAAHPRIGNSLYTGEFYRLCRQKLSLSGILCQWMPQIGFQRMNTGP
jgi:spermidine synthase